MQINKTTTLTKVHTPIITEFFQPKPITFKELTKIRQLEKIGLSLLLHIITDPAWTV